jgi:hypothetical protein
MRLGPPARPFADGNLGCIRLPLRPLRLCVRFKGLVSVIVRGNPCSLRILSAMPAGEGSAFGSIPAKVH